MACAGDNLLAQVTVAGWRFQNNVSHIGWAHGNPTVLAQVDFYAAVLPLVAISVAKLFDRLGS